jgi:hypothetical protein
MALNRLLDGIQFNLEENRVPRLSIPHRSETLVKSEHRSIVLVDLKMRSSKAPVLGGQAIDHQGRFDRSAGGSACPEYPASPGKTLSKRVVNSNCTQRVVLVVANHKVGLILRLLVAPDPLTLRLKAVINWRQVFVFCVIEPQSQNKFSVFDAHVFESNGFSLHPTWTLNFWRDCRGGVQDLRAQRFQKQSVNWRTLLDLRVRPRTVRNHGCSRWRRSGARPEPAAQHQRNSRIECPKS